MKINETRYLKRVDGGVRIYTFHGNDASNEVFTKVQELVQYMNMHAAYSLNDIRKIQNNKVLKVLLGLKD